MTRRQFAFWLGFGLFSLSEKLRVSGLDALAAAAMRRTESSATNAAAKDAVRSGGEHWAVGGDKRWWWFERENLVNGDWWLTGITTPVNKETGERKPDNIAYLDDSLVPTDVRASDTTAVALASFHEPGEHHHDAEQTEAVVDLDSQLPTAKVRGRHGRPPSKWLRSLNADELRIWLKTVKTPEAGVSGMTVWTHLTRDHSFSEAKIEGLTEPEQNKLHAAAHFGF